MTGGGEHHFAEFMTADLGQSIEPAERLIEISPVGPHTFQQTAILCQQFMEKELCFAHGGELQDAIELRIQGTVRRGGINLLQIQPLIQKGLLEARRPRITQEPLDLCMALFCLVEIGV